METYHVTIPVTRANNLVAALTCTDHVRLTNRMKENRTSSITEWTLNMNFSRPGSVIETIVNLLPLNPSGQDLKIY